jgi:hypothetical protein
MHLRRSGLDYVMGDIQKIVPHLHLENTKDQRKTHRVVIQFMHIAHECIHTNSVTIRPIDKMWMTSEICA